jgi:hypothetical protein
LLYKRDSLGVINGLVSTYATWSSNLRGVVWDLLGERTPAHTTLYGCVFVLFPTPFRHEHPPFDHLATGLFARTATPPEKARGEVCNRPITEVKRLLLRVFGLRNTRLHRSD